MTRGVHMDAHMILQHTPAVFNVNETGLRITRPYIMIFRHLGVDCGKNKRKMVVTLTLYCKEGLSVLLLSGFYPHLIGWNSWSGRWNVLVTLDRRSSLWRIFLHCLHSSCSLQLTPVLQLALESLLLIQRSCAQVVVINRQ